MRTPSQKCYDLIKRFEGYHRALPNGDCKGYPDPGTASGKPYTIGWGTTQYRTAGLAKYGRTYVLLSDTLTREQADAEFQAAVAVYAAIVNRLNPSLTQGQFDAAVSFVYNAGPGTKQSDRLKNGDLRGFEVMLAAYNKGGDGKVLQGLVNRRAAELALWRGIEEMAKVGWLALTRRGDKYYLTGMDGDTAVKQHEFKTTAELISLLRQYPEAGTTVVTKEEWTAPVNGLVNVPNPNQMDLLLERTGKKEAKGCEELKLSIRGTDLSWICRSGQPWAQTFDKSSTDIPGSMRPLPAGRWKLGPIEFAGGRDNYDADFSEGLGPVWIGLEPMFQTRRSAIGIHFDGGAYGTAGCLGIRTMADLKSLVAALRKYNPKTLEVVW